MQVLVAGGTGFVGTALVATLTDRGHAVTVLARSPDDAALPDGVEAVAADVTDPDRVQDVLDRTAPDAVVNLVALSPLFRPTGGDAAHERVHLGGTRTLVDAAERSGADRFLQMSALGADPEGPTHYLRAKGRSETVVRESDLAWTVARPSVVFGDGGEFVPFTELLTTPYLTGLPGGGSTRFQPIWVDDLAPMLADCLDDDRHAGETYELGGPAVLTLGEVAREIYRARGQGLWILPVPMLLARVGLTLAELIPGSPMGVDQYRSLKLDNTVTDNDVDAFGRDPGSLRTLAEYLHQTGTADRTNGVQESEQSPL